MSFNGLKIRRAGGVIGRRAVCRGQTLYRAYARQFRATRYDRFLISSSGRSGSTLLLDLCDSHPEVSCLGELLHPDRIYWHRRFMNPDAPRFLAERARDPMAFLQRHLWYPRGAATKAVGFKLLHDQLVQNRAALRPLTDDIEGLKVIHLRRDNVFDIFLSTKNFDRTDESGQLYRLSGKMPPPLHVDLEACHQFFRRHELSEAIAKSVFAQHRSLTLSYDDLSTNLAATNSRICAFLEVSDVPLRHSRTKLSRGALAAKVANLDEVQRHFRGTKWEHMLEDG